MYKIYDNYGNDLVKVTFIDWDQVSSSLCQKTVFSYKEFRKFDENIDKTNALIKETGLKVVRVSD